MSRCPEHVPSATSSTSLASSSDRGEAAADSDLTDQRSSCQDPTSPTRPGPSFSVSRFGQAFCPICLERYTLDNPAVIYSPCDHAFHLQCAESWLMRSRTCPVCGTAIARGGAHVMTPRDVTPRSPRCRAPAGCAASAAAVSREKEKMKENEKSVEPVAEELAGMQQQVQTPMLQRPPRYPHSADCNAPLRSAPPEAECGEGGGGDGSEPAAHRRGVASATAAAGAVARAPLTARVKTAALASLRQLGAWCRR